MTLLLTGATGLIGSGLVERLAGVRPLRLLVRRGEHVSACERVRASCEDKVARALDRGTIEVVEGDLTLPGFGLGPADLRRLGAGLRGIVHLAARTDFFGATLDEYAPVNVTGTLRMARLAADLCCPFHFLSTAYVSGRHSGIFRETDGDVGQRHHNPYEESKLVAETCLHALARQRGFPLVILRPSVVLPERPRQGGTMGPGPLVYLKVVAGLQGRCSRRVQRIRYPGKATALVNLVDLEFVLHVLEESIAAPGSGCAVYHLTSPRPITVARLAALMNECLRGIEVVVVPERELLAPDRYERLLARHCEPYQPYLFLDTRYDRSGLERNFVARDRVNEPWLRRVFRQHLCAWRRSMEPARRSRSSARLVHRYFRHFLRDRTGMRLVPGLEKLKADFTVTVNSVGSYRLKIVDGVLLLVERVNAPSQHIDYRSEADALLAAVAGRRRPAELFFQQRVQIRGDLYEALATATALEEFFQLHPFRADQPAKVSS